ncbi:MAG: hypothetical protein Q8R33_21200 [Burkholderiales bacterium]|nr:hypothetical protein [Burkholderiales bacterium]
MHSEQSSGGAGSSTGLAFLAAADLQDHLMTASNDLDRLQTLLADACDTLQAGFFGASRHLHDLRATALPDPQPVERAVAHLGAAVTALQFQDMASQLINHTKGRLRNCADRLARDAFDGDDDGDAVIEEAPLRPNPVTQSEMDTGFIELF